MGALQGLPPGVAVAVPDATRPMDLAAALAALRPHLGGSPAIVVGRGVHRPPTAPERGPWEQAWGGPLEVSDPDDFVTLGDVDDVPCTVSRALAVAPAVLAVGLVELHQYAGVSGGHKAAAVGCAGRPTLDRLHARDLVLHPDVVVGRLAPNPFRERVDALGRRIGVVAALLQVGTRWVAGPPEAALAEAARLLDPWETVARPHPVALLRVPPAKARNLYQASRAATYLALSPRPPVPRGGLLVVDAACPEGLGQGPGELAFAALLRSVADDHARLLDAALPSGAGAQRALLLARLALSHRWIVAGCEEPAALEAVGIRATRTAAAEVAGSEALVVERPFERLPQLESRTD